MIGGARNFHRVYDLRERASIRASTTCRCEQTECRPRAVGKGLGRDRRDPGAVVPRLLSHPRATNDADSSRLVDEGVCDSVAVEGWKAPAIVPSQNAAAGAKGAARASSRLRIGRCWRRSIRWGGIRDARAGQCSASTIGRVLYDRAKAPLRLFRVADLVDAARSSAAGRQSAPRRRVFEVKQCSRAGRAPDEDARRDSRERIVARSGRMARTPQVKVSARIREYQKRADAALKRITP